MRTVKAATWAALIVAVWIFLAVEIWQASLH